MILQGKRALVTGASRGIGLATARALLAAGARIAINGRTPGSVAAAIDGLGAGCEAVVGVALDGAGFVTGMALPIDGGATAGR